MDNILFFFYVPRVQLIKADKYGMNQYNLSISVAYFIQCIGKYQFLCVSCSTMLQWF